MRLNSMTRNRQPQSAAIALIPDCANLGVVFKILLSCNLIVYLALLTRGDAWLVDTYEFLEASSLLEIICMSSLLSLAMLRCFPQVQALQPGMQRLLCGTVPAGITAALLLPMAHVPWFNNSFPRMNEELMVVCSFIAGLFYQWYFELRARAFSPALEEARLQALQARIRPHFLFNSLNAVLSLIRSDPRRAESVLEDLADLFRVLMRDTRSLSSLQDEIVLCQQYLAIEKLRLGERLQVQWSHPQLDAQTLQQIQIPALLLQPLLENAVRYGVEPATDVARIQIEIRHTLEKIHVRISNPCHVVKDQHGKQKVGNQMALENIRKRLDLLYDLEAQFKHQMLNGEFILHLSFPARKT